MTLRLHWFLPLHGDGREVAKNADGSSAPSLRRAPTLGYLSQVAQAVDGLGFVGALVPTGLFCEDPWVVSSALAAHTTRMHFMIAMRPGSIPPMVAAQMAATFQRISGGRLMLNIVTGGDADEQQRYGDWLDHDQRYDRTAEFLDVWSRAWEGKPFDFTGNHFKIKAGLLTRPHPTRPLVLLGGSSAAAQRTAAVHADVYLSWGEPPDGMVSLTKQVGDLAATHGRTIEFGTRFHVISRDTSEDAWEVTERLL
ncbi:MAG: LLM class flavin-dependent oxidoreductase, partial [Pseudonocardiaceae bacterium]